MFINKKILPWQFDENNKNYFFFIIICFENQSSGWPQSIFFFIAGPEVTCCRAMRNPRVRNPDHPATHLSASTINDRRSTPGLEVGPPTPDLIKSLTKEEPVIPDHAVIVHIRNNLEKAEGNFINLCTLYS